MARVLGPTDNDRQVQRYIAASRRFEGFGGKLMTVCTDAAATTPAAIHEYDPEVPGTPGAAITGGKVRLDKGSRVPRFWYPDGVTTLYGKVGSEVYRLDSDDAQTQSVAAAAPTTGAHVVGERVWNSAPAAGGTIGWVCTTAGTPGTWKTFGTIAS